MTISKDEDYGLTLDRLRKLLAYDPETGLFVWNSTGKPAGYIQRGKGDYRRIGIDGRCYLAHRIAWFYSHGKWPNEIDHADGDGLNNRLSNLRECDRKGNCGNRGPCKNSKSEVKGIHKHKTNDRWVVQLGGPNVKRYIGSYRTLDEAREAYNGAAEKYFGEFARLV